jgi:hypothetical protein
MAAPEAMREASLRSRVLQYVAAKHGISTGDAQHFIEGKLYPELNVIPGLGDRVTLGQVLDHLDNPYLDGPAPAKPGGQAMLDTSLRAVFSDHELLNRVVKTITLDQGINTIEALERLHRGVDAGSRTLGEALGWTGAEPADIEQGLRLMERREEAVHKELESALGPAMLEQTNERGQVLLDQGAGSGSAGPPVLSANGRGALGAQRVAEPLRADIGKVLGDPAEFERRLQRARQATGEFTGDQGREQFRNADRQHAEAGIDYVRTIERPREIASAQAKAAQVGRKLDQAIKDATGKRQRVRALDEQIAALDGQRAKLAERTAEPGRKEAKLRLLDAAATDDRPLLSVPLQQRIIALATEHPGLSYEERRRRVLEAAEPGMPLTADEEAAMSVDERVRLLAGELESRADRALSDLGADRPAPEPAAAEKALPPGVAESRQMDKRVRDRMRTLDRPSGEYLKTLEEMWAEAREDGRIAIDRSGPLMPIDPEA